MEQAETSENTPNRDDKGRLLPGHTANPNGRPKGTLSLLGLLKKHLEDVPPGEQKCRAEQFIQKTYEEAMSGDSKAIRLIWNYIEGMPQTKVDLTTGGQPIPILGGITQQDGEGASNGE